ncbi:uncharacterized protein SPSK_02882 [Sporothrix schenckii 1099-18]|uniref:Uncharacterized protein n=1 Tax=Sporothrix schenckii 1099-18 TaxID=1397361 RepID=A0A0F2MAS0_SPOSC|nr:uncharacterized protein SPSK_02882 [Sporothrix schenckii 1099-18]KJR86793.1 hypothetical protein SPSK_02882 [Sporothrix schenckii 1099-18]
MQTPMLLSRISRIQTSLAHLAAWFDTCDVRPNVEGARDTAQLGNRPGPAGRMGKRNGATCVPVSRADEKEVAFSDRV